MQLRTRLAWLGAAVALLVGGLVPAVLAAEAPEVPDEGRSPALCGADDSPETGIQGDVPKADQDSGRAAEGYNCGLAVVGHNPLEGAGGDVAWSDHCAYVKANGQVLVVDLSDPTNPTVVTALATGDVQSENIHAVTTRDRAILIASRTPPSGAIAPVRTDVFDVRDCDQPRQIGTINFPENVHNIELNPRATKVYGSMPMQEADISNPDSTKWTVRRFQCEVAAQYHPVHAALAAAGRQLCDGWPILTPPPQAAHEFEFNATGTRLYIGDQGNNPNPYENLVHIIDMTVWPPQVIGSTYGAGHGIRRATINGKPFLLNSDETAVLPVFLNLATSPWILVNQPDPTEGQSDVPKPRAGVDANGCIPEDAAPNAGAAQAHLTDISDETAPYHVSMLGLAINRPEPEYCAAQLDSGVHSTVHYHEVDDPDRTTFAMVPMGNAGLRVFDVRNPDAPREVAYFNPGQIQRDDGSKILDSAGNHMRYDAATGHIWVTTRAGGFWVLELEPQVREALALPRIKVKHKRGAPARGGSLATFSVPAREEQLRYYCQV